ncbi:MAG: hypothetical protein JNM86_10270 [Phycisphaerae bacterium]|nr:hypothetical protein [Phycisphaerae bacterium]
MRQCVLLCVLGVCVHSMSASAAPIWDAGNYFTHTQASAMAESPFDWFTNNQGGNYSGLIPPRDDNYSVNVTLPNGDGESNAVSTLRYWVNGNTLSIAGSVSADVDPGDFMIAGTASATSNLTVQFTLENGGTYRITEGGFFGTHAGSAATMWGPSAEAYFTFDSIIHQPDGESGVLPPGGYSLELTSSASSDYFFFNGLFADASYYLDIEIIPASSCTGDLNADGVVDDADFIIFVAAYNILDCADPSMPPGCPADLNDDSVVDDADFVVFVPAYNDLVCP